MVEDDDAIGVVEASPTIVTVGDGKIFFYPIVTGVFLGRQNQPIVTGAGCFPEAGPIVTWAGGFLDRPIVTGGDRRFLVFSVGSKLDGRKNLALIPYQT